MLARQLSLIMAMARLYLPRWEREELSQLLDYPSVLGKGNNHSSHLYNHCSLQNIFTISPECLLAPPSIINFIVASCFTN
jgi:hypothetical protein